MKAKPEETARFMDATRPFVPELLASATHHIRYHQAIGDLVDELSPEELVGETSSLRLTRHEARRKISDAWSAYRRSTVN